MSTSLLTPAQYLGENIRLTGQAVVLMVFSIIFFLNSVALLAVGFVYWRKRSLRQVSTAEDIGTSALKLPLEVMNLLRPAMGRNANWHVDKDMTTLSVTTASDELKRLRKLVCEDMNSEPLWSEMGAIPKIDLVDNSVLINRFSIHREILQERLLMDPMIFKRKDWTQLPNFDLRDRCSAAFIAFVTSFPWNKTDDSVPLIPVAFGTSKSKAENIVRNGFTAETSLYDGNFGAGMYFTTSVLASLGFCLKEEEPCALLCVAAPGNPFPAIEGPQEKLSQRGKPIKSGYQSTFALANQAGLPYRPVADAVQRPIAQLVIAQENQIVPFAILHLDKTVVKQLYSKHILNE